MATRIDHTGHPHPSTPAARALCRANGGTGSIVKRGGEAPVAKKTAPPLTESRVPIVNIDTGKVISRQAAAEIMFGTAVKLKPKKRSTPAKKTVVPKKSVESKSVSLRDDPEYVRNYERGWKAGARTNDLTRADKRGESSAYYDGFSDRSIGEPKWTRTEERDKSAKESSAASAAKGSTKPAPVSVPTTQNIDKAVKSGIKGQPQTLSGGAIAITTKIDFKNGTSGVQKVIQDLPPAVMADIPADIRKFIPTAKQQQDSEELGSMFARAIGLDAPEVTRVNETTTIQQFKPGKVGVTVSPFDRNKYVRSDEGLVLAVMDQVIGNNDRNLGNWLIDGGSITPIDFSGSWNIGERLETPIDQPLTRATDQFQRTLREESTGKFKDNDMAPEDMDRMSNALLALRPEFAKRKRLDEWEWSMRRLLALRKYAKGTRRRIK